MNKQLQQTVKEIEKIWGLEAYSLQHHSIYLDKNIISGRAYILEMEWLIEDSEEDSQPENSILLEVNLDTKKTSRFFLKGKNHLKTEMPASDDTEAIIEWIESMTGLEYGRQFMQTFEQDNEYYYHAAVDNIPVFPNGSIHLKYNEDGNLSLFSIDGHFPNEEEIHWEPFDLTKEVIEETSKEQCQLIEIPLESEEKWISTYYFPVHYISNDGKKTLLDENLEKPEHYIEINERLVWEEKATKPFVKQEIKFSSEVTSEQAFEKNEPIDEPLTSVEIEQTKDAALQFMQQTYPEDSGEWKISAAWPNFGYIFTEIRRVEHDAKLIERKIKLIINRQTMQPLHDTNNDDLLEVIRHFKIAESPVISKEKAFQLLKDELNVTPVYVYDTENEGYYLYGRVCCPYGIEAKHGKKVLLDQNYNENV